MLPITPVGNLPNLYIVADGMGGHKAGDLASSYAVQTIVEAYQPERGDQTGADPSEGDPLRQLPVI